MEANTAGAVLSHPKAQRTIKTATPDAATKRLRLTPARSASSGRASVIGRSGNRAHVLSYRKAGMCLAHDSDRASAVCLESSPISLLLDAPDQNLSRSEPRVPFMKRTILAAAAATAPFLAA